MLFAAAAAGSTASSPLSSPTQSKMSWGLAKKQQQYQQQERKLSNDGGTLSCLIDGLVIEDDEGENAATTSITSNHSYSESSLSCSNLHELSGDSHPELKELPGNDRCADCGSDDTEWGSMTFGVLICTECCRAHQAMGGHFSHVRSLQRDYWSKEQLQRMKFGGNDRFNSFVQEHFAFDCIQDKYTSEDAENFRRVLDFRVEATAPTSATTNDDNELDISAPTRIIDTTPDTTSYHPSTNNTLMQQQYYNKKRAAKRESWFQRMLSSSASLLPQPAPPTITYLGRSYTPETFSLQRQRAQQLQRMPAAAVATTPDIAMMSQSCRGTSQRRPGQQQQPRPSFFMADLPDTTTISQPPSQRRSRRQSRRTSAYISDLSTQSIGGTVSRIDRLEEYSFDEQDVLDITLDENEFHRLQKALKFKGAVTNELIKQRMHCFVNKWKRRQRLRRQQTLP